MREVNQREGSIEDAFEAWFGLMLKRDEAGRALFYPWRRSGFVLPSEKRTHQVRRALMLLFMTGAIGVPAVVAAAGVLHGVMAIALWCIAYVPLCAYLIRGLPPAQPSPDRTKGR